MNPQRLNRVAWVCAAAIMTCPAAQADSWRKHVVASAATSMINSAVANAQQADPNLDVDELYVSRAVVDEAPPLKRSRHRAMGRVFGILKRSCHITIDLDVPGKKASGE